MTFLYLLKVSACTVLFFAGYQFLLAKLTFFRLNRIYLLTCLILSFVIPALTITNKTTVVVHKQIDPLSVQYSKDNATAEDFSETIAGVEQTTDWSMLALNAYFIVVGALLLRMVIVMGQIQRKVNLYAIKRIHNIVYVDASSKIKNCSFLNKIIVDASLPLHDQQLVIKHESVHVLQNHALDKILVNLAVCMLWFNPLIYLWRSSVEHNHEFLADEATAKATDKKQYAELLLQLAMPSNQISIHHFSKLPLKNRIAMMYKNPNPGVKKVAYLTLFPLVAICCLAFINQKDILIQQTVFKRSEQPVLQNINRVNETNQTVEQVTSNPSAITAQSKENEPVANANVLSNASFDNGLEMNMHAENELDAKLRSVQLGRELILVIDAGHGGKDGIANGANGEKEKDLNLNVVTILKEEADKRKIKVVLTRNKDEFIALRDRLPGEGATAFISIHHNSMRLGNTAIPFGGIEAFVAKSNPNLELSEKFAARILNNLGKLNGIAVRKELKSADLLLLRESKVPAMVLELGNISSSESVNYLKNEENLRKICNLILDGYIEFTGC